MRIFLFLVATLSFFDAYANKEKIIDSLKTVIKTSGEDTNKVNSINSLSHYYRNDTVEGVRLCQQAIQLSENLKFLKGKAKALKLLGDIMRNANKNREAIEYYQQAESVYKKTNNRLGQAACAHSLGATYWLNIGDLAKALEKIHQSLTIYESIDDSVRMASAYNALGVVHGSLGNIDKTLGYYEKCLAIRKRLGDEKGLAQSYYNIGITYTEKKDFIKAEDALLRSLQYYTNHHRSGVPMVNSGLAEMYMKMREYETALDYYLKSVGILTSKKDHWAMAIALNGVGAALIALNRHGQAIAYLEQSAKISKQYNFPSSLQIAYDRLADAYSKTGNYKKAYEMRTSFGILKDSTLSAEKNKAIAEMESKYQFEKQQLEISNLEKAKALEQEKLKRQKNQNLITLGGLGVSILLGVLILIGFVNKRKDNQLIKKQKAEVESQRDEINEQKQLVEEKNKEITDSINYAKRIQDAYLPPANVLEHYFPDSFLMFLPKDIVSGDFYWFYSPENKNRQKGDEVYVAVADCTGHGVPGAIMSVICCNALNEAVITMGLKDPGKILDEVRKTVIRNLKSNEQSNQKDGMDISLCCINKKEKKLVYSGANNPLWVIQNNELLEFKANKQPIGAFENIQPFQSHVVSLEETTNIYIFSDGYADQFGGAKGKKFKYRPFKELLLSIHNESLKKQQQILEKTLQDWKGNLDQVDDICIIGIKV